MWWKRISRCWKPGLQAISVLLLAVFLWNTALRAQSETTDWQSTAAEEADWKQIGLDILRQAAEENRLSDPETVRSLVERFGACGHAAVDSENQVDMVCREQVEAFCEQVSKEETGEVTIVEVTGQGAFAVYALKTADGVVSVDRSYYRYSGGTVEKTAESTYVADYWNYTQDGYLIFSGIMYTEELYLLTLSETEECKAFRVQPLEETCRELNRQYIRPIGYKKNNLFNTDWSEENFGELDFCDVFDVFYQRAMGQPSPYVADDNLSVGAVYEIPAEEFEHVIQTFLKVDSASIREKTDWCADGYYVYRPRGFYEVGIPDSIYPEVTAYRYNVDGTLTLTVHAVYPYGGTSRAVIHEVVVRLMENGGVQYVSNHILSAEEEDFIWYVPRLSEEEWEEIYGLAVAESPCRSYTKRKVCLQGGEGHELL